ncbi:MAG: hypothetical protein LUD72_08570 [Bacteroidales bacterium]|nr:hypothetical protein [Bacteroidales bacterium]
MKNEKPLNGVFWDVDGQLFAYPFREDVHTGGVAKSGKTYAHEKLWEEVRPKGCNKPFDYYPRGRTVVNAGKRSVIYMSPHVDRTLLPKIIRVFGLEEDPVIRYDHSKHYKCHLDSEDD